MRIWDTEESLSAPSLVLEQDFILKIRRLHRLNRPYRVANVRLREACAQGKGQTPEEAEERLLNAQRRLQELALSQGGAYAAMANGDAFLIWPESELAATFPDQVLAALAPNGLEAGQAARLMDIFHLPKDYIPLRERADRYVELSRELAKAAESEEPERLLMSDRARGPLTPWSLGLIGQLIENIGVAPYIRVQTAFQRGADGAWLPCFDESFIGLEEIRQRYFPHTDLARPKHLFLDLCVLLDRTLLDAMAARGAARERKMSLNLALPSILGAEFAALARAVPDSARASFGFEIDCSDLIQDFSQTLRALSTLRDQGFFFMVDGLTPEMAGFFRFEKLRPAAVKIDVSRENATSLKDPETRKTLAEAQCGDIVFYHCEDEAAIRAGLALGVTQFQGRAIDERARTGRWADLELRD